MMCHISMNFIYILTFKAVTVGPEKEMQVENGREIL